MKTITEPKKEVPVLKEVDVVVVGGGAAGIGAALAAGRSGAKTVLLERFNCLGGCQTLTFNSSFSFIDDRIQGGIIREVMEKLKEGGAVYDSSEGAKQAFWSQDEGCYYFEPEYYKLLLNNLMEEANVQLLYHTFAVGAIVEGKEIKGVVTESYQGRQAIMAKTVIDATGIADFSWKAGAEVVGEEGYPDDRFGPFKGRHMGFGYGYMLGGCDVEKFRNWAKDHPEWNYWVKSRDAFVAEKEKGDLYYFRDSMIFQEYDDGRVWMLGPGYPIPEGHHCWEAEQISNAVVDIRKQAWSVYEFVKRTVPGFENTRIEQTANKLLFRDGHRIVGEYTLTEHDMYGGKTFEDSVACSNMAPDPFFPNGGHHFKFNITPYDIPYRCLLSGTFDNLMAVGGNASTDLITFAANRYCVPAMCQGQAAGTAAAMAAKQGVNVKQIDVAALQKDLQSQGLVTTNKNLPESVIEEYKRRDEEWGNGFGM